MDIMVTPFYLQIKYINCLSISVPCICQSMTLHIKLCAFPMHLRSSSTYSDVLHIRLHMLHNSAPPPASAPPHVLPPLVCLFVYLCHWHTCCLFCLFVS